METVEVNSPSRVIQVTFMLKDDMPFYNVAYQGKEVIRASRLGFLFDEAAPMADNLRIANVSRDSLDEVWEQPWGEVKKIRNHYNELQVQLEDTTANHRVMIIKFRVFDDGIGFRYEFPEQEHMQAVRITDELTQFALTDDYTAWWIPAYQKERYEYLYTQSPVSELDTVHTPLTMQTAAGLNLSIHEANLTDYASMTLAHTEDHVLECDLVPWSDGIKVKTATPFVTPWRTIQITETPGELITSYLILNLNEPNRLEDVSWIKPGKYVGIWWGMHIGVYTWGSGEHHGATTENAKRYIDFADKYGFDGVLVEGWNIGWDGDWTESGKGIPFTTAHPDFDIKEVSEYAVSKGVNLIGHHETVADVINYEQQLEQAFTFYKELGIKYVKTGYVGWGQGIKRIDETGAVQKEWHHGQHMVRHYRRVVETAAKYQIMLDVHEPIKDTGIRRTYPNMMTREGARGQEYNAWGAGGGNPPEHTTILPFTRCLSGPFDMTPGIFDLFFEQAGRPDNRVNTTLAKQLALYVVIYSPLHMAADLPENYENQPAFRFLQVVPTDWQDTRVLNAQIGDYITVARQDSKSEDWYIGSLTDEQARSLRCSLAFLDSGRAYMAEIYADGVNANWESNPLAIDIREVRIDETTVLDLELAAGGGQVIRIRPIE